MNEPPPTIPSSTPPAFKDRRTGLIVFGMLEVVFGIFALLMVPMMILGYVMAAKVGTGAQPIRQLIPGVLVYGTIGVLLILLGIGSCKCRRWARALSLVAGWGWLLVGVLSVGMMGLVFPGTLKATMPPAQGQPVPESVTYVIIAVTLLFMSVFMILVPAALVYFYANRNVKATCEARDPVPGWTDACPLPVLGLSLWLGLGAVTILALPLATSPVLPVFGKLVTGPAAWLGYTLFAATWAYCAHAIYRQRALGWWIAFATLCLMTASMGVTFNRVDILEMYELMGYTEQQIEMMRGLPIMQDNRMAFLSLAGAVPMLAWLLYVKRYIPAPDKR